MTRRSDPIDFSERVLTIRQTVTIDPDDFRMVAHETTDGLVWSHAKSHPCHECSTRNLQEKADDESPK